MLVSHKFEDVRLVTVADALCNVADALCKEVCWLVVSLWIRGLFLSLVLFVM